MKEVAFTVKPGGEFYNKYFKVKKERQRFRDLARVFFKKYDLVDVNVYYQAEVLGLKLNAEQKNKFAKQLKRYDDKNGVSIFKKRSPMQKAWNEEVTSNIDFKIIDEIRFWYFSLINCGSYNLWDYNGNIYGYLEDRYKNEIELPDYMTEIKMSDYYSALENSLNDKK